MPSIKYDHTTINYSGSVTKKKYIVWHDTGVKGQTAAGNANYFRSVDRQSSAHYFVDKNAIVEVVDPNLIAWHCGDGAGYSFLTKSAKIKLFGGRLYKANRYSFLTKSAKIKPCL